MGDIVVEQENRGYTIHVEKDKNLLSIHLRGFFDVAFEEQFRDELFRELKKLKTPRYHLVDIRDYPPQPPEVQAIRQEILRKMSDEYQVVKVAYLVGRALNRMQTERLIRATYKGDVAFFESEAEARKWLFG